MFKNRSFIPLVLLSSLTLFFFLALSKAFWVVIQVMILKIYDDTTPLAHINAVVIILSLALTLVWPQVMARVSSKYLLSLSLILAGGCAALYPALETTFVGYILALFILLVANVTLISVMAIINQSLNDKYRTTFMGIFNTFYNLSIGLGPFLLVVFHNNTSSFYLWMGVLFGLLGLIVLRLKKNISFKPRKDSQPRHFIRKFSGGIDIIKDNRILLLLMITTTINMAMASHLLVFWGDSYNLPLLAAKELPAVFALGAVFLVVPISYLADRKGPLRIYLLTLTALICAYTYLSLDALFEPLDYVALFILGGGVSISVAITSSYIGRLFSGYRLVQATAGFNFMRMLAGIGGVYIAGELIDQIEAYGLNWVMSLTNLILFVFLLNACYQNRKIRLGLYEKSLHPN